MIRRMELVDYKIFINVLNGSSISSVCLSAMLRIKRKTLYIISKYNIFERLNVQEAGEMAQCEDLLLF